MDAGLLDNVAARAEQLNRGLQQIADQTGAVTELKGLGLLIGVQFKDKVQAADVIAACYDEKMLVVAAKHNVVRLLPPLNVTAAEIDEALEKFGAAVEKVAE